MGRALGRVGGYKAPVDTAGMDREMTDTLEITKPREKTPFEKAGDALGSVVRGLTRGINSSGSKRSPSTMSDRGHPKPAAPTLSDAERERLSKKYLGR